MQTETETVATLDEAAELIARMGAAGEVAESGNFGTLMQLSAFVDGDLFKADSFIRQDGNQLVREPNSLKGGQAPHEFFTDRYNSQRTEKLDVKALNVLRSQFKSVITAASLGKPGAFSASAIDMFGASGFYSKQAPKARKRKFAALVSMAGVMKKEKGKPTAKQLQASVLAKKGATKTDFEKIEALAKQFDVMVNGKEAKGASKEVAPVLDATDDDGNDSLWVVALNALKEAIDTYRPADDEKVQKAIKTMSAADRAALFAQLQASMGEAAE